MIDYDSFSHCHLTDIFFAIFARVKELSLFSGFGLNNLKTDTQTKFCLYWQNRQIDPSTS